VGYTAGMQVDSEVRDKILAMVEDFGTYLKHPPAFREVYESLVVRGQAGMLAGAKVEFNCSSSSTLWLLHKVWYSSTSAICMVLTGSRY
jgi:hypothetical protein